MREGTQEATTCHIHGGLAERPCAAEFGAGGVPEPLAEMLRFNISREFQIELNLNLDALQPSGLVVVDGMFRSDVDRVNLHKVVEALHALHDMA